jgi:hypothetical protein
MSHCDKDYRRSKFDYKTTSREAILAKMVEDMDLPYSGSGTKGYERVRSVQ